MTYKKIGYASKENGKWAGGRKRYPREHGTLRGFDQHRNLKEKVCDECKPFGKVREQITKENREKRNESQARLDGGSLDDGGGHSRYCL